MTETAPVYAPDAPAQERKLICALSSCAAPFTPRKPWQKFHTDECRREFHRTQGRPPMRGVISKVSVLKRGKVSAVIHFGIDEQDRSRQLTPGQEIEIV